MKSTSITKRMLTVFSLIRKAATGAAMALMDKMSSGGGYGSRGYKLRDNASGYLKAYTMETWTASCIDFRALNISQVPWKLVKTNPDGTIERITEHEILDLIKHVNPISLEGPDLFYFTEQDLNIYGVAYWFLDWLSEGMVGSPKEIFRLDPRNVTLVPSKEPGEFLEGYEYRLESTGASVTYSPRSVIRFQHPNPQNAYEPLSPLKAILRTIELSMAAEIYNLSFFRQGRPDVIISTEQELTAQQAREIRDNYLEEYAGSIEESHGVAVFGKGATPTLLGNGPRDADYTNSAPLTMLRICSRLRVNPTLLGDQAANRATAEAAKASFWHETGIPQLLWFSQILNSVLVPMFGEKEGLTLLPDFDGVIALQKEELLKIVALIEATGIPILTADEGRERLGMEPKGGEAGLLHIPNTMIPIGEGMEEE